MKKSTKPENKQKASPKKQKPKPKKPLSQVKSVPKCTNKQKI